MSEPDSSDGPMDEPDSNDGIMGGPSSSDGLSTDDAEKLWLDRAVHEPDAWRARATSAAGLLSAAAAATLAGLLIRREELAGVVEAAVVVAGVAYTIAVVSYLVGAVWPPPPEDKQTLEYANEIWDYCLSEARPIRNAVLIGSIFGGVAILATGLSFLLAVRAEPQSRSARVALTSSAPARLTSLCPGLKGIVRASVARRESFIRLRVRAGVCGPLPQELELERSAVIVLYASGFEHG